MIAESLGTVLSTMNHRIRSFGVSDSAREASMESVFQMYKVHVLCFL